MQLSDVDRARAVAAILRSGASIRKTARKLEKPESTLRRLLKTLAASLEDQELARHNQISTIELIRCGQPATLQHAEPRVEAAEIRPSVSAREGADLICNWLSQTRLHRPSCAEIIKQVRRTLDEYKDSGLRPPPISARYRDLTVDQIFKVSRPVKPAEKDKPIDAFYVQWLTTLVCAVIPDAQVRNEALQLALQRQEKK